MLKTTVENSSNLAPSQIRRLERFSTSQCVDVHCHCLPGLDDGPETYEHARLLCDALAADGITAVIATPHQMGLYERRNGADVIREASASLNQRLQSDGVALRIVPGADVRVDDQLLKLLDDDHILTLADDKRYLLLELPHDVLIDLTSLIGELSDRGISAVISHPERHAGICRHLEILFPWMERGAFLQITAGSLTGDFGPMAERIAWRLVTANLVSLVATDAHDHLQRLPLMTLAIEALVRRVGHAVARRICIDNPQAVLQGRPLVSSGQFAMRAMRQGARH